jgi:hypothetical protein
MFIPGACLEAMRLCLVLRQSWSTGEFIPLELPLTIVSGPMRDITRLTPRDADVLQLCQKSKEFPTAY